MDKFQFGELIRNFIFNAIKHGFDQDSEVKVITFNSSFVEGKFILRIWNTGKPFPDDFSFDEFVTFGKRTDSRKGSGIGGYLISKVVKNHGGIMKILRKEGRKFIKALPGTGAVEGQIAYVPVEIGVEFYLEFPLNYGNNA